MACGGKTCSHVFPIQDTAAVQGRARALALRCLAGLCRALARLGMMFVRARQRRALRELDDRLMADIGKTREEAMREAEKRFWQ